MLVYLQTEKMSKAPKSTVKGQFVKGEEVQVITFWNGSPRWVDGIIKSLVFTNVPNPYVRVYEVEHWVKYEKTICYTTSHSIRARNPDDREFEFYKIDNIRTHSHVSHACDKDCGIQFEFHVQWFGYGPEHNTWEPESNALAVANLVTEFFKSQGFFRVKIKVPKSYQDFWEDLTANPGNEAARYKAFTNKETPGEGAGGQGGVEGSDEEDEEEECEFADEGAGEESEGEPAPKKQRGPGAGRSVERFSVPSSSDDDPSDVEPTPKKRLPVKTKAAAKVPPTPQVAAVPSKGPATPVQNLAKKARKNNPEPAPTRTRVSPRRVAALAVAAAAAEVALETAPVSTPSSERGGSPSPTKSQGSSKGSKNSPVPPGAQKSPTRTVPPAKQLFPSANTPSEESEDGGSPEIN